MVLETKQCQAFLLYLRVL